MIGIAPNKTPVPSDIVHHLAYGAYNVTGYVLLCDSPWVVAYSTYHARVMTEVDPVGRTMTITLTRDLVDCMSCLVAQAQR